MFKLPETKPLLTLYGQETREEFSIKPQYAEAEQP